MLINLLASLLIVSSPVSQDYNCSEYDKSNLIRSEIMLQVVLKNYGYYTSKIDGDFGPASKKALKEFQSSNNLVSDGILGKNTCKTLNNRANVVKKTIKATNSINTNSQKAKSTAILNVQKRNKRSLETHAKSLVLVHAPAARCLGSTVDAKLGRDGLDVLMWVAHWVVHATAPPRVHPSKTKFNIQ